MKNKYLNSILEGDTIEMMKKLENNSIYMLLVDLPYGITQNKWDVLIPFEDLWKEYNRIVKENGAMVFTAGGIFSAKLMLSNEKYFKYKIIWEKSKSTNFLNAKKQPLRKFEEILVFYRKQPTYHPQMTKGVPYDKGMRKHQLTGSYGDFEQRYVKSDGERYPVDIVYFKTAESEGEVIHPTQKPVSLAQYLIKTYTNPGDTVLDNTSGSGSFLVGAVAEGRNFIGIEKNEHSYINKTKKIDYVEESKKRIVNEYNKLPIDKKETIIKCNLINEVVDNETK